MNNPVQVVQASGTLISATLSLGYDVHHSRISEHLKAAAEDAGLEEPFVHIVDLNDATVTYRVVGLLQNVVSLVSKRSELRARALDRLHGAGIEVVSPTFMSQRSEWLPLASPPRAVIWPSKVNDSATISRIAPPPWPPVPAAVWISRPPPLEPNSNGWADGP